MTDEPTDRTDQHVWTVGEGLLRISRGTTSDGRRCVRIATEAGHGLECDPGTARRIAAAIQVAAETPTPPTEQGDRND